MDKEKQGQKGLGRRSFVTGAGAAAAFTILGLSRPRPAVGYEFYANRIAVLEGAGYVADVEGDTGTDRVQCSTQCACTGCGCDCNCDCTQNCSCNCSATCDCTCKCSGGLGSSVDSSVDSGVDTKGQFSMNLQTTSWNKHGDSSNIDSSVYDAVDGRVEGAVLTGAWSGVFDYYY